MLDSKTPSFEKSREIIEERLKKIEETKSTIEKSLTKLHKLLILVKLAVVERKQKWMCK